MACMTLRDEVDALTRRVESLERHLRGEESRPTPAIRPTAPDVVTATPPPVPTPAAPKPPRPRHELAARIPKAPPTAAPEEPAHRAAETSGRKDIEWRIGARAFAVIGALGMIIGIGLFLNYAVQQGWLHITPAFKCLSAGTLGILMLGAGEVLRQRLPSAATAALSAVGLVTMYASFFAAYSRYEIVGAGVAFPGLVAISALGLVVSIRARSLLLGVLSQIGAGIVPFMVFNPDPPVWGLPAYGTALLALGYAIPMLLNGRFGPMRHVAGGFAALYGVIWTLGMDGMSTPALAYPWYLVSWLIVHVELIRTNLRPDAGVQTDLNWKHASMAVSSAIVTLWTVGFASVVAHEQSPAFDWLPAVAAIVITALGAFMLAPGMGLQRRVPKCDRERLAAVLIAQTGGAGILAIALAFTEWHLALAWAFFGIAAVFAAHRTQGPALRTYGLILLAIGTVQVMTFELYGALNDAPLLFEIPGLVFTTWTALVLVFTGAWAATAFIMGRDRSGLMSGLRLPAAIVASLLAFASPLHPDASAETIMFIWLVMSAALLFVSRRSSWMRLDVVGMVGLLATTFAWMQAHVLHDWSAWSGAVLLHPGLYEALLIGAAAWTFGRRLLPELDHEIDVFGTRTYLRLASLIGAAGLVFLASTLEVSRTAALLTDTRTAELGAVSLWWGLVGTALVVLGFLRRERVVRMTGLALMSIAAAKVVFIDSVGTEALWRIASFFIVGLLMLLVAFVYAAVARRLGEGEEETEDVRV